MEIKDLTLGQLQTLLSMFGNARTDIVGIEQCQITQPHPLVGQVCVVRTYSAGVHIGEIVSINGTKCELKNAQRLFSWKGAFTLSEVANIGVSTESRLAMPTAIYLSQAIEYIPATAQAIESFKRAKQG